MPDVPYPKPVPPTRREATAARVSTALDSLGALIRNTLTGGSKVVSLRRSVLYLILGVGIALQLPAISLIALILLALTDAVVEL
jgi:hypothetical protein